MKSILLMVVAIFIATPTLNRLSMSILPYDLVEMMWMRDDGNIRDAVSDIIDNTSVTHNDVLWLARTAYSETNNLDEAYHIMWIIRNRVNTRYRNKTTYQGVVLDPYQFSVYNRTKSEKAARRRAQIISMHYDIVGDDQWNTYLKMAAMVATLNASENPLPTSARHFVHLAALTSRPNWLPNEPDYKINKLSVYTGV